MTEENVRQITEGLGLARSALPAARAYRALFPRARQAYLECPPIQIALVKRGNGLVCAAGHFGLNVAKLSYGAT